MSEPVICPRCGAGNPAGATNCQACRINLQFARENPAEIERIRAEDASQRRWAAGAPEGSASAPAPKPLLMPTLLLFGSFVFAFCLGEAVHELGHFIAHRAHGVAVGIRLDPFGGSHILHGSSAPQEIWGITSLAGPLFNLLAGTTVSALLWRFRRAALLPFLLWGPIAMVQEGVTFSLGLLTPGGDAQLIADWGPPAFVLAAFGALLLLSGMVLMSWILPLSGLSPSYSFGRTFAIVSGGMVSFMVVRFLHSALFTPSLVQENIIPLVFSLLLATLVAALFQPVQRIFNRVVGTAGATVTWPAVASSAILAVGMVVFQLVWFN